jgi:hypothetical protein
MTTIVCGRYTDGDQDRELVLVAAAAGSRLLIDRRATDGDDPRLLAHLSSDEPDLNARLVCREFLAGSPRCARPLRAADYAAAPDGYRGPAAIRPFVSRVLIDASGQRYVLRATGTPAELRWQHESDRRGGRSRRISARDVVGALEDYEPVCTLTRAAVERYRLDRRISVAALAVELRRLESSPIVLNRRLRQAVLDAVREDGVSLSAIAMACGRVKRDQRGNGSGETSWLARRVGLLPSGPTGRPNPWVHSATLALIARQGLGVAPREVELP